MSEERLDRALVIRGLVSSREKAQRLIESGLVLVDGQVEKRAKKAVKESHALLVLEQERYVSRGGLKLEAALKNFEVNVEGLRCLDVGASTGGFTDCLLQYGAAFVLAVDVGHGQLVQKLQDDPRVESREGVNVREWKEPALDKSFGLICADVSFISLRLILPSVLGMAAPGASLLLLVKPQFEVGRENIGKGGIVKDDAARESALEGIKSLLSPASGWNVLKTMECPVEGKTGNREYLLCAKKSRK
jgi:23S rRNA (cytidine1920-2'-O)/16S rRNA (cytidine1409-2'-O)-methyltransferase